MRWVKKYSWTEDDWCRPNKVNAWSTIQQYAARYAFAAQFTANKTVLNVACGSGYDSNYMMKKGASMVIGGDIDIEAIEYARARYKIGGLYFLSLDAQLLPFRDNGFDVVVSLETIEHLVKYEQFVAECNRVLKDGGIFVCSTPNKGALAPEPGEKWASIHVKEFYVEEFQQLISKYFREMLLYGIEPKRSEGGSWIAQIRGTVGPWFLGLPQSEKLVNLVTKFIFRGYRLVILEQIEELDSFLHEEYKPFLLKDNLGVKPNFLIAVAKK